jgi:hypothetical protein
MTICLFILVAVAAWFVPVPVAAHHVAQTAVPRAPAKNAPVASFSGYVDEIFIDNRITGELQTARVLFAEDGKHYLIDHDSAAALSTGAAYGITGQLNGSVLFVATSRMTARSDARRTAFNAQPAVVLDGRLRLGHADNFDGGPSEFFYAIVTDARQYRIRLGTMLPGLENGMRATVSGRIGSDAEFIADRIIILAAPERKAERGVSPDATITTSYIVIPVKFPTNSTAPFTYGTDPFTTASLATSVFGVPPANSVAEYYKETSYGQQLLSGTVADNGSGGWLLAEVAKPATCDIDAIATAAENAATARGYNLASYVGRVYVFTSNVPGCSWSGLAYINWERSWIKQTSSLLVISHELGHNFGLLHAAALDCGTNVIGGTCTSSEYGDPFGAMGNSRAMHFNSVQKDILGWIPSTSVKTHTKGRTTYTLAPLESPGGSTYAVKIPAATKRTYWLEYRQPIGFDSGLSAFPNNGAQFRVAHPFESLCSGCDDDTEFLDMTPATASMADGALIVGRSYTDALNGITVNVNAATATSLTLEVQSLGEPPKPDFDFSGSTDLLWRHLPSGQSALWLMSGVGNIGGAALSGDGSWAITGTGDFTGDGKSDLLWRSAGGATAMWLMNGAGPASTGILSGDASWTASHVADFNGDGKSDLVWRSTSGATAVWLLNGLTPTTTVVLSGTAAWTISKIGDFNGDGKADLLWRNTAGASSIWLMNGTVVTGTSVVGADPAWQVVEVGDFNGDGTDDLVWRNTLGTTVIWLMNGTTTIGTGLITTVATLQVERVADFDGDGKSDLLLRNTTTGATSIYLMNGTAVATSAVLPTSATMQVSGSGDYNGDGRADLIWRDSVSGATSIWLMNGTAPQATQTLSTDAGWSAHFPGP